MVRDGAAGAGTGVRVPHSVAAPSQTQRRDAVRDPQVGADEVREENVD